MFGFLLVGVSAVMLFWNEGRSVKRYKDLNEGAGKVVTVSAETVAPSKEGQLVHLTGEAVTSKPLQDSQFGVSVTAIKLQRSTEMYQWVEHVDTDQTEKVGGSVETTKTYSYSKEWRSNLVDSSQFRDSTSYRNPGSMRFPSKSFLASDVTVGAFSLPDFLVGRISGGEPLAVRSLETLPAALREEASLSESGFYFGQDPSAPSIGDMRITFSFVPTGTVSLVAQQSGKSFVNYVAETGGKLSLLTRGASSAEEMFTAAHEANKVMTWGIRIAGFFLMAVGFSMILKPLAVFASILPFLGRIVETGTTMIGFLLAGILWTIVVAFAWIFYRPILGISLLVITIVLTVLIVRRLRAKPGSQTSSAGAPPPLDTPPPLN